MALHVRHAAGPAPDVLAQMAAPIYATLIMPLAKDEDKMAVALERAHALWVLAHAAQGEHS